jgi:hypothetical protein
MDGHNHWIRTGSQKLPPQITEQLHPSLKRAAEIPLCAFPGTFYHELVAESVVIGLSKDGQRVKVRNCKTARVSVFPIEHVHLFRREGSLLPS